MGFLQRLLGKRTATSTDLEPVPAPRPEPQPGPEPAVTLSVSLRMSPLTKVAGTTTFAAAGAEGLVRRRGRGGRGVLEDTAVLQRDPTNPVDPNAVAVLVDGEHIGALPSPYARATTLDVGAAQVVPVQVSWAETGGKLRVEAWVWLDDPPARWAFSAESLPPMTTKERAAADHARTREMVADAVAGGGHRAAQFQAGMVQGVHYLEPSSSSSAKDGSMRRSSSATPRSRAPKATRSAGRPHPGTPSRRRSSCASSATGTGRSGSWSDTWRTSRRGRGRRASWACAWRS